MESTNTTTSIASQALRLGNVNLLDMALARHFAQTVVVQEAQSTTIPLDAYAQAFRSGHAAGMESLATNAK